MNITAEEKIWLVVEAIANGFEIAPTGRPILINPESIGKVSSIDLGQILQKLAMDKKLIEIISNPTDIKLDETNGCYSIRILNEIEFRNFLNITHSRHFGAINKMAGDNFLAVCDVAMDICSELQIISEQVVSIPIVPSIIKFSSLCPAKSVGLLDRYGDFRMKALAYMREREHIMDYQIVEDMMVGRWDREVNVIVDRFNFEKFYQQLGEVYEVRVVKPAKEQEKKSKNKKEPKIFLEPMPTKIEITAMPELQFRNVEDNSLTKGKKRIHLPKFKPTDWSKISIRFLDEQNVLINTDKKEQVVSDYEALGFADEKRNKPNLAWMFFYGLAQNNGETEPLPTPIPDNIKQQKRQLSDRLKTIFKNDTDPFYDPTETRIYKIKINLIPPQSENEEKDKLGVREYLKETMTEEYEEPYNEHDR